MLLSNDNINNSWRVSKDLVYHFLGIGGVAMGNTAIDLKRAGFTVTGSDSGIYSPMKEMLAEAGIAASTPFAPENLPGDGFIIVGNAISRDNMELEEVLNRRMAYTSLSEFLRWGILQSRKNLVVAGTHGKTTTTALLAHLMQTAGMMPGYMIGGAPLDFPTGFSSQGNEWFVIEGDEYDTAFFDKRPKFLHYLPYGLIINNIEYDHSDIYHNVEQILDGFRKLMRIIPQNGVIMANHNDRRVMTIVEEARCPVVTFGMGDGADFTWEFRPKRLIISKKGNLWGECEFKLPGRHNFQNAVGAAALMDYLGLERAAILQGMASFRGVHRRLEYKGENRGVIIYDDFAHHPTAVDASIRAVKETHPGRRVWAVFQPRSNTSVTNVFQKEWAAAFRQADVIVLADLYRKEKIPPERRLNRELLKIQLEHRGREVHLWNDAEQILREIVNKLKTNELVLVMSNADFSGLAGKILDALGK